MGKKGKYVKQYKELGEGEGNDCVHRSSLQGTYVPFYKMGSSGG